MTIGSARPGDPGWVVSVHSTLLSGASGGNVGEQAHPQPGREAAEEHRPPALDLVHVRVAESDDVRHRAHPVEHAEQRWGAGRLARGAGLVARDGPGGRGRRSDIVITDDGRDVLAAALPGVREFHAPESLGLDVQQLATLDELLDVVLHTLGDQVG